MLFKKQHIFKYFCVYFVKTCICHELLGISRLHEQQNKIYHTKFGDLQQQFRDSFGHENVSIDITDTHNSAALKYSFGLKQNQLTDDLLVNEDTTWLTVHLTGQEIFELSTVTNVFVGIKRLTLQHDEELREIELFQPRRFPQERLVLETFSKNDNLRKFYVENCPCSYLTFELFFDWKDMDLGHCVFEDPKTDDIWRDFRKKSDNGRKRVVTKCDLAKVKFNYKAILVISCFIILIGSVLFSLVSENEFEYHEKMKYLKILIGTKTEIEKRQQRIHDVGKRKGKKMTKSKKKK